MHIQTIKSASGIEAWLVEEHALPMLSLRFSFEGGSAHDPAMQEGIANFHASAVSAGAGFETIADFHEGLDDLSVNLGFGVTKDALLGSLDVLSSVASEAAGLMKKALFPPRFEGGAVDKARDRILTGMAKSERDPNLVARKRWDALVFAGHPYARAQSGKAEALTALGATDLLAYNRRVLARDGLKVVAVGDLTPETFSRLLDELFGELPLTASGAPPLPGLSAVRAETVVTEGMAPQSTVVFGMQASSVQPEDHAAEMVLNQIIGGAASPAD
jgi:zinc protease